MSTIEIKSLNKVYKDNSVIEDLNLFIKEGERLVLLGPSGCGKSTILRMIAGIEEVSSGQIFYDGQDKTHVAPGERNVAMVFQNYALYPHMTVEKNITYALKRNKVAQNEINARLENALEILELKDFRHRKPNELSGGQRQRVALARAVVKNAKYFLLDEPLSNLDALLRVTARQELIQLHESYKHTFIYVTHDQIEAMALADRIVILNKGKIQMLDTPDNVYYYPANVFTAKFIGNPPMNIIKAKVVDNNVQLTNDQVVNIDIKALKHYTYDAIYVGIRPEHITIKQNGPYMFKIDKIENYGGSYGLTGDLYGQQVTIHSDNKPNSTNIHIDFQSEYINLFDIETEENIQKEQ